MAGNMKQMMKQVQKAQEEMQKKQEELGNMHVEASSGGGGGVFLLLMGHADGQRTHAGVTLVPGVGVVADYGSVVGAETQVELDAPAARIPGLAEGRADVRRHAEARHQRVVEVDGVDVHVGEHPRREAAPGAGLQDR